MYFDTNKFNGRDASAELGARDRIATMARPQLEQLARALVARVKAARRCSCQARTTGQRVQRVGRLVIGGRPGGRPRPSPAPAGGGGTPGGTVGPTTGPGSFGPGRAYYATISPNSPGAFGGINRAWSSQTFRGSFPIV